MKIDNEFLKIPVTFKGNLPLTYISNYEKVKNFFPYPCYIQEAIFSMITTRLKSDYPRDEIVKILQKTYNPNENNKPQQNLKLFLKKSTFVIITGQQPDLLTGPMYIIYKALSVIKFAEKLKLDFPEYDFVPMFWINSDDHDIDEINQFTLVDKDNNSKKFSFDINSISAPINKIDLTSENILELKIFLTDNLRETEYTKDLISSIELAGNNALNINKFFILLMRNIFDKFGLLILDGCDSDIKKLGKSIFEKEISNPCKLNEIIQRNGDLIENLGFKRQINQAKNQCSFFVEHNGQRKKVQYINNEFVIDNKKISRQDLLDILQKNPEKFSPNVALRPILQDYLLPTISYMGGPAEISYFAQFLNEGYKFFNVIPPIIYPRASATILEDANVRILEKHNINILDILNNSHHDIINAILKNKYKDNIDDIFNELNLSLNNIEIKIKNISPELLKDYNKMKSGQEKEILRLKNRILDKIKSDDLLVVKQLTKLLNHILPDNELQERKINIFYYLNKYSNDFIFNIYNSIIIDKQGHNILKIT